MSGALLKPFALFADLGDAERDDLFDLLEERDVSAGETLFEAGDEADALVLVLRGRLQLTSRARGETVSMGAGSALGGLALFSVGARGVTATGAEPGEVRLLRREDFLRFAEDHPRAAFRIAAALASEVALHARAALAQNGFGSVDPAEGAE